MTNSVHKLSMALWLCVVSLNGLADTATTEANEMQLPLQTFTAEYQECHREYVVDGVVEAIQQATVTAQTSGEVLDVLFDVDEIVEADAVIVRLKGIQQQASKSEVQAQLREAQARVQEARSSYDRIKAAFEKQAVAATQFDTAKANLRAALARLDLARAALKRTEEQVDYTTIRAPYSGIVLERHIEPGEIANPGQAIMTGFSLDALRTVAYVSQSKINAIRRHSQATILVNTGEDKPMRFMASDITITPHANIDSHSFKVRVDFPLGVEKVYPGMFTKVIFVVGGKRGLIIPRSAIAYRNEVHAVYVVDDTEQVSMRQIRIGNHVKDKIEVIAGLREGEQVALNAVDASIKLKAQRRARQAQVTEAAHEQH